MSDLTDVNLICMYDHIMFNRREAGLRLYETLKYLGSSDIVVMALPRGGVVVGAEIAKHLGAPLGVVLVRKVGYPYNPEYAIGAIAENEKPVFNYSEIYVLDGHWLTDVEKQARGIIDERRKYYYEDLKRPDVKDKTVILVDDGMATGLTMKAAIGSILSQRPKKIIVSVPVASIESIKLIEDLVDSILMIEDPSNFMGAVSMHYLNFHEVTDEKVKKILHDVNHQKIDLFNSEYIAY